VARRLVRVLPLRRGNLVVEAGAGHGVITEALAELGCRVVAVEKDPRLYRSLRARFLGRTNVECHLADFLRFPLPRGPYRVVSNVPFGAMAGVVRRLVSSPRPPRDALLVLQREAAGKFAGVPRETLFSLLHKPIFEMTIAGRFRRTDFAPPPSVHTALLRLRRREQPLLAGRALPAYRRFVATAFGRAPAVGQALRPVFTPGQTAALGRALGFEPARPLGALSFEQWLAVFRAAERLRRSDGFEQALSCARAVLPLPEGRRVHEDAPARQPAGGLSRCSRPRPEDNAVHRPRDEPLGDHVRAAAFGRGG
jgi:23S rRNA (adenine-N6)-dimethyltransferase